MTIAEVSSDREIIEAINGDRLAAWGRAAIDDPSSGDERRAVAEQAVSTCAAIRRRNETEAVRLVDALEASGIEARSTIADQRHSIRLDLAPDDASRAIDVLRSAGFAPGREWQRGAARSRHRFGGEATLTRSQEHSTVVRLRWRPPTSTRSKPLGLLRRAIIPTAADWAMVDLPDHLWWAYSAVRPVRLVAERFGIASDDHGDLEPFLVTPDALLGPLFDVAEVQRSDLFADIGCGDGRIVVAAAQQRGCRSIGVEQSAATVSAARTRVDQAGLSERVEIVHGDALGADLSSVTVALLFVPTVVASRILPTLSERFARGARIVVHEQSRLPATLPTPSHSVAIIAPEAVTVAHRFDP